MMDGAALPPAHQVPQLRYLVAALLLGAAGSMIALAAFAAHDYRVGPLVVRMDARPATSGTTELAVSSIEGLRTGHVEAPTHAGFLSFRGTVVGVVGQANLPNAVLATKDPFSLATTIRDQGRTAMRQFALRVGWITAAGGAAGGAVIALLGMKARRVIQGAVAGLVLVGALGLLAWQTYDIDEFRNARFRAAASLAASGLR